MLVYKEEILESLKVVYNMKSFVILVLVSYFAYSQGEEDVGCSLLNGNLILKQHEAFDIGDACLRIRCQGNDNYKITMGCETRWRGAPTDFYNKEIKQLAENVRKGWACSGTKVPDIST